MGFRSSILAGDALIRQAIKSPNFVPGSAGWSIFRDGTAEFSDLTIRSSDGTGASVDIENGVITIRNSSGDVVSTYSKDGIKVWDNTGTDLLAEVTLSGGTLSGPGFIARYDAYPYIYSFFGDGGIQWVNEQTNMFNEPRISMSSLAVEDDEISMGLSPGAYTSAGNQPRLTLGTSAAGNSEIRLDSGFGDDPDIKLDGQVLVHGTDVGRGVQDFTAITASSAAGTAEAIGITSGTVNFEVGRAYRMTAHFIGVSTVAADVVNFKLRRTNLAGNTLLDSLRSVQIPTANQHALFDSSMVITNQTGSNLSTVIVGTYSRASGTGNVQMFGNTNANRSWLEITDIGAAADYPNAYAL